MAVSSGPADARMQSELADKVDFTSLELARAIKTARAGHRGVGIAVAFILQSANVVLRPLGFELSYHGQPDPYQPF